MKTSNWKEIECFFEDDYSSYKEGSHNNGGDYSFHYKHLIFQRGENEFLHLTKESSSANFGYSEDGKFTDKYDWFYATNVEGEEVDFAAEGRGDNESNHVPLEEFPNVYLFSDRGFIADIRKGARNWKMS